MYHYNITFAVSRVPATSRSVVERLQNQSGISHIYPLSQQQTYLGQEDDLKHLLKSDLYILDNHASKIDAPTILFLIVAMIKRKPIVITNDLRFPENISLFVREVITSRLNKLLLCDLRQLDDIDLRQFIASSANQPVNYVLTKHEEIIMRSLIRSHFRKLLSSSPTV